MILFTFCKIFSSQLKVKWFLIHGGFLDEIAFFLAKTQRRKPEVGSFGLKPNERLTSSGLSVDVINLDCGFYALQAITKAGAFYIGKFVVMK